MHRQGLSLPLISPETACRISDGRLPVLQKKAGENFKPLNVCLTPGANIIIGANMTGKTTVLKTIYFILQAFRFGLPVPCNELFSHFPTDISLLLKSSGNIDNSLSGFGCELDFFARKFPAGSVILTDELFQTTDPANGTRLAQIFITEFNRKDHLFLCSTHYAQIPELCPETKIFRMRDVDFKSKIDYHSRLRELAERIPYEIEEVSESERRENSDNSLTPLKIALIFPLAEEIKTRIKSCLQEQAEMTEEKGKL
jgi:DNA mismatch repair ATPase MutS